MVDFALNLGYNDLYSDYCGQYMTWQGNMKLGLRRRQLELMFRTHYYLLLKAITTQNYEQLEMLTEEKLTLAIAAQMYEIQVLQNYTFDCNVDLMSILDGSANAKLKEEGKRDDELKIVNHVFVRNCAVQRDQNPCLSQYQLTKLNLSAFDYTYERKKRGNALSDKKQLNVFEDGSLKKANAIEIIDEMLDYKKMYQLEQSKLEQ